MADLRHLINPVARANARADFGAPVPQAKPLVDFSRDPNYTYGTVLPFRKPIAGGPAEWDLGYSALTKGIADAFTAPGRALSGEELAPEEAINFALGVTGGGQLRSAPPGAVGMMRGRMAGNLSPAEDDLLQQAAAMAADRTPYGSPLYTPREIWANTGAYVDVSGKPYFAINPHEIKINPERLLEALGQGPVPASDIVDIPTLSAAFPEAFKDLALDLPTKGEAYSFGMWEPPKGQITIYPAAYGTPTTGSFLTKDVAADAVRGTGIADFKQTLAHETAHFGQYLNDLAGGSAPGTFQPPIFADRSLLNAQVADLLRVPLQSTLTDSGRKANAKALRKAVTEALGSPSFIENLSPKEMSQLAGLTLSQRTSMFSPTDLQWDLYKRTGGEVGARHIESILKLPAKEAAAVYTPFEYPVEMQLPMSSVSPFNALAPTPEQAAIILRRARTFNDYGDSPIVGGSQ